MTFIKNIALVGWMDGWMNWRIFGNASKDDDDSDDKINALLNCVASNLYATDRDIVTLIPVIIYARDCLTQLFFTSLPFRMNQTCILKLCNLHLYFIFVFFFLFKFFFMYTDRLIEKEEGKKKHIKHQP